MSTVALLLMTTGGFQVVKATNQSFTLPAISATYARVDYSLFEAPCLQHIPFSILFLPAGSFYTLDPQNWKFVAFDQYRPISPNIQPLA